MDKKQKMLIVDDSEMDREILSEFFNDKYDIIQADNGFDALITAVLEKDNLAMIILDVMMPLFNGFETLQKIRSNPQLSSVPVILITAEGSMENVRQGFQSGMTDFIVKPFDARNIRQRVEDAITKFNTALNRKNSVGNSFDGVDYTNLADMVESMFEFRMIETPRHIKSVQSYTGALMKYITRKYVEYGIPPEDVPMIQIAAAFHDIGKLALPDAIINKPESQLSESERHIMQEHTLRGCLFVKCL